MKYFAILKDSLRETIDSKVFYVTIAMSILVIGVLATLRFEASPPDQGLQKITDRFPDGSVTVDLPLLGKIRANEPYTKYGIEDLQPLSDASKPWDAEYKYTLVTTDQIPQGFRIAALIEVLRTEEQRERTASTGRKTRWRRISEEIENHGQKVEKEVEKELDERAKRNKFRDEMNRYIAQLLGIEAASLTQKELETFVREQLENQANWVVTDVKQQKAEPLKIQMKVMIQEGNEQRIKTEEAEGETNKFFVTMKSREGTYRLWPHKVTLMFGYVPLGTDAKPAEMVYTIQSWLVGWIGAAVILLLSCIITAFFFPNMLRKGTVDLLLAKPIRRWTLLLYKYIGGMTFMFVNTALIVLGLWIVFGIRAGIWEPGFIYMIFLLTFQFAFFYACSTLAAVLTRSSVVAILVCIMAWTLVFLVGWTYRSVHFFEDMASAERTSESRTWWASTTDMVHAALPHYMDVDKLGERMLYEGLHDPTEAERKKLDREYKLYNWFEALGVTSIYIVVMLGLSCWRFSTKDY